MAELDLRLVMNNSYAEFNLVTQVIPLVVGEKICTLGIDTTRGCLALEEGRLTAAYLPWSDLPVQGLFQFIIRGLHDS